ncbi:DUF3606 domain-containing protein [Methylobacterium persicinum]|uniref:DUF3606 domain-containing protein n=1 Tax=Methylobacterium persicinum TaxID=374426 RepID=A0ABU0HME5_9HYPH|nr:DUF3606 domain-containing protein [Methylobacterium persicinum]MDQ0443491.1 hypothetical protein [Methylobacterium persicinum]GJE38528.1 hypothetical protein KHHGKMAE_2601 [Methylobacterium persicinum]
MPTDLPPRSHIDIHDRRTREAWSRHFDVTDERLRKAVRIVGSRVATVAAYFGRPKP